MPTSPTESFPCTLKQHLWAMGTRQDRANDLHVTQTQRFPVPACQPKLGTAGESLR